MGRPKGVKNKKVLRKNLDLLKNNVEQSKADLLAIEVSKPLTENDVLKTFLEVETPLILKEKIIKDYFDNLSKDKIIFTLNDTTLQKIIDRLEILKQKYPFTSYKEFIDTLLNVSLNLFLDTI